MDIPLVIAPSLSNLTRALACAAPDFPARTSAVPVPAQRCTSTKHLAHTQHSTAGTASLPRSPSPGSCRFPKYLGVSTSVVALQFPPSLFHCFYCYLIFLDALDINDCGLEFELASTTSKAYPSSLPGVIVGTAVARLPVGSSGERS